MLQSNPILRVEVLLVTADLTDCPALTRIFSHSKWQLLTCRTIAEATRVIHSHPVGVVICKETVSDGNWKELLTANSQPNHPKLFVATTTATAHLWAEALREGADYVLETPFNSRDVYRAVSEAWQRWWYTLVNEHQFDKNPNPPRKPMGLQLSRTARLAAVGAG
jgi:DNA-binding NtrC family response regulator